MNVSHRFRRAGNCLTEHRIEHLGGHLPANPRRLARRVWLSGRQQRRSISVNYSLRMIEVCQTAFFTKWPDGLRYDRDQRFKRDLAVARLERRVPDPASILSRARVDVRPMMGVAVRAAATLVHYLFPASTPDRVEDRPGRP